MLNGTNFVIKNRSLGILIVMLEGEDTAMSIIRHINFMSKLCFCIPESLTPCLNY